MTIVQLLCATIAALVLFAAEDARPSSAAAEPSRAVDHHGLDFPWRDYLPSRDADEERLLVVVFLGVECPLARLYAERLNDLADAYAGRGVRFLAVDSNAHDSDEELAAFAGILRFASVRDADGRLARRLPPRARRKCSCSMPSATLSIAGGSTTNTNPACTAVRSPRGAICKSRSTKRSQGG